MAGPQADEIDWENMTKKELHDKFQQMLSQQVEDVMATFGKALERIDDIEKTIDTKLDAKFDEVLARLPQPPPTAPIVPLHQEQQHRLQIKWDVHCAFPLSLVKIMVPLYLLLMLL